MPRIMRDHDVGAGQPCQQFRRNGRKFRGVLNIKPRQSVNFSEVVPKQPVPFWRPHQPIGSFRQVAIFKDGHPGGADAHAGIIGRFKIEARDVHCVGHGMGLIQFTFNPNPAVDLAFIFSFAAKPAFLPNYFRFFKSLFLGENAVGPSIYKGFFALQTPRFRPSFCTHGADDASPTHAIMAP